MDHDVVERVPLQTPTLGVIDAFHLKPRPDSQPARPSCRDVVCTRAAVPAGAHPGINQGGGPWLDLLVDRIEQK